MSNHAHFIIRAEIQTLSYFMAAILAEYASYYNYKHKRNGHVFQNRFNSECIESEEYYWNCLRYIHLNPVKANMIQKVERYKYSSISEYLNYKSILVCERALELFGEKFAEKQTFLNYHKYLGENVYIDVEDEVKNHRKEVAIQIVDRIKREKNLKTACQIIEEKEYRMEYILELQKKLNISQKDAKELCEKIRNLIK